MPPLFSLWCKRTDGATAIEYGLIAAGIALALITVIYTLGDQIAVLLDGLTGWLE